MSPKLKENIKGFYAAGLRQNESLIEINHHEATSFKKEINPWRKRNINDFKILKKLVAGGYGEVYLAS